MPASSEKAGVFYGATNNYLFMLYFYSIYERLMKGLKLVEAKVQ